MDKKVGFAKIYSPSKLKMFDQCPKSYDFYYRDPIYSRMKGKLKRLPQNIFSFHTLGKAVHDAITLFYHLSPKERTEKQLLENLKETWRSEFKKSKKPPLGEWGGFKNLEEERDSYRQAILMLKNFLKIAEIKPEIEYLPTKNFSQSIGDYIDLINSLNGDFNISGKFDLITKDDGVLHIVDFKTSKKEDDNDFQLKFYKVLAEAKFEKPVRKASFYFLRTGSKKEFSLEGQEAKEIKKEILEKIGQIQATENFETKPSKLCQFCLFKTFCPERKKVNKIVGDTSEEDFSEDLPF